MIATEDIVREALIAGVDDWVYLGELAALVRAVRGDIPAEHVRTLTCTVVRQLLEEGFVRVGDVVKEGFRPWTCSTHEALARIEAEWTQDRRLLPGDICWLESTESGLRRGEHYFATVGSALPDD